MVEIKDRKKFGIFLIALICFVISGFYLIKKIADLKNSDEDDSIINEQAYNEGINKISEGDFESASKILEESLKKDADNHQKLKMLAVSQYNEKKYKEAEENFKKLLKADSENNFVYYNSLANIYRDQKSYEEAIENYQKAIEANNQYETAYQNLAILYLYELENPDLEKAQEIIEKGLENIPGSEALKRMR